MYSLWIIFFCIPLYFSRVFSFFDIYIWDGWFERQKVLFFAILVWIAYIEWVLRFQKRLLAVTIKYWRIALILLIIPFISTIFIYGELNQDFLIWTHEKHHGYLFYMSIVWFLHFVLISTRVHLRMYLLWSIWAATIVSIVSIGEWLWGPWDIYGHAPFSLYPGRSWSTLGNPNYLAGYLLLLIPLIHRIRSPEYWIILPICTFALFTTGSYTGMVLLGIYFLYQVLRSFHIWTLRSFLYTCVCSIFFWIVGYISLDPEKLLSLMSRFVLMRESFVALISYFPALLFGFGPDSVYSYFSDVRSWLINQYFPPSSSIDSFHSIWIDILFQYWVIVLWLLIISICKLWKYQKEDTRIAILLGSIFLWLNVFVVAHIVLLVLIMSERKGDFLLLK